MAVTDEPTTKNVMAFFDGQNLYQHAKDAFGHHHPNYDPVKLHNAVCTAKGWRATLTRFYTGVPSQAESPMWAAYWSNRVIAMKRAGIAVTTRPLRYRKERVLDDEGNPILDEGGKPKMVTTPQEKGVDVRDRSRMTRKRHLGREKRAEERQSELVRARIHRSTAKMRRSPGTPLSE
jgi:hypothetical protein